MTACMTHTRLPGGALIAHLLVLNRIGVIPLPPVPVWSKSGDEAAKIPGMGSCRQHFSDDSYLP